MITQETLADRFETVRWHGRYFAACCPFHDSRPSNPSLLVYPDGAVCLSASCRYYNRRISLEALARQVGINPPPQVAAKGFQPRFHLPLEQIADQAHWYLAHHPEHAKYLHDRGVAECIQPQQLGWWEGWYTIPVFEAAGHFSGLILRAGPSLEGYADRYTTPPGQPPQVYVPNWPHFLRSPSAYVVFGIFDALTLARLGLPVITGTVARYLTPSLLQQYRKKLYIVPDRGEEEVGRQLVSGLDWRGQLVLLPYPPGWKDPNDYDQHHQANKLLSLLPH